MAARHKHMGKKKAKGGAVYYEGGESNVAKEAAEKEQKKHGGRVKGKKAMKRMGKARGGSVSSDKSPMAPGSARHPFSSASR